MSQLLLLSFLKSSNWFSHHVLIPVALVGTAAGISEQLFLMLTKRVLLFEYIKRHILWSIIMPCIRELSLLLLYGNLTTGRQPVIHLSPPWIRLWWPLQQFIRINLPLLLEAFSNCPSLHTCLTCICGKCSATLYSDNKPAFFCVQLAYFSSTVSPLVQHVLWIP